jgi:CRISPR-associated protein Csd2
MDRRSCLPVGNGWIAGSSDGYVFEILESRGRDRKEVVKEMGDIKNYNEGTFLQSDFVKKYWDARLFGNTFLEDGGHKGYIKTGVVQYGMGLSVSSVTILRHTNTKKMAVQEGKGSGMAPLAYRVVQHGVYVMPFFTNPSLAKNSGCKPCDVELLKRLMPYAYEHTRSAIRPDVRIRHAWWLEHSNPLGSCPDHLLIDALTPKRKGDDPLAPSMSWADYDIPTGLPGNLKDKVKPIDLMG